MTALSLQAQNSGAKRYGIYMEYVKGYSKHIDDGISSNILKIHNNTTKHRKFNLRTVGPVNWMSMGSAERIIDIAPEDSAFIPVRVIPQDRVMGGEVVRFKSSLYNEGMLISTADWIIETETVHKWSARILKEDTHFFHDSDSTTVSVYFKNDGNINERFNLDFYPSRLLQITDHSRQESFTLGVGRDTTIGVSVKLKDEEQNAVKLYEKAKRSYDKYSLKIKAQVAGQKANPWQRSATFTKAKTEYKENKMKWEHLPLTIDFQTYDILSENPYASLGLYGIKYFDVDRYLSYNFQFLGATGENASLQANYQNVFYHSRRLQIELGDIANRHLGGISMQGKGAMIRTVLGGQHAFSGLYTRSSRLLENNRIRNYSFEYAFDAKKHHFASNVYYQNQRNVIEMYTRSLAGIHMSARPFKDQQLSLQADMSQTRYGWPTNTDTIAGYNVIASYNGRFFKVLNLGANYQFSSPDFVSYAGAENIKAFLNMSIKDNQGVMGHYINRKYSPHVYNYTGLVQSGLRSHQEEAKLSYRYRNGKQGLSFFSQYNDFTIPDYHLMWYGGGLDYINTISLYSRFNTSLSIWRNKLDVLPDDYTSIHFRMSLRQRNLRLSALYYYGARYMMDHINYAESLEVPRSYFVNANYELWMGQKKNVLMDVGANFNYRSTIGRLQVSARPNLEYYVSQGFKLKGYANIVLFNQEERIYELNNEDIINPSFTGSRFEMGLGFVKDIGLPMSRKNNFDIKFVAFCDDNGNGVKDANEEVIPNMLIVATELTEARHVDFSSYEGTLEVITNENGEAALLNIDKGNYKIETHPLQKLQSWYSDRNFSLAVLEDKTVYLPQAKGGKIYGSIQLEVGNYTRFERDISVENIRVSATDSAGMVYSCLTDKNGAFILNAPMGTYKISVNEELFSGAFELADNNMVVSIDNRFSEKQQNFFVKEKERKIVITKFADEERKKEDKSRSKRRQERQTDVEITE